MKNSKTFRLFVSSTFSDFAKERAVLQKKVFPNIKKYCASKGYAFQPIDLRWGVSNEAQLDQKTIELCLNEVRVCKTYPHPNFLIMAGDRYGWIPLPYMVECSEFEMLLELMNQNEKDEILFWYQLDLNQLPASYILKRREGKYEDWKEWSEVENNLREILQAKVTQASQENKITEALKRKYFMSATEAEVEEGIFDYLEPTEFQRNLSQKSQDLPNIDKNNIFGFFRNIKKDTSIGNIFVGKDYGQAQTFKENVKKALIAENVLDISTTQKSEDALDESYLEKLEEKLFGFLKTKVDAHIENEKQYSEQETKQQAQEYFLKEKTNNFIGREDVLDSIAKYISDDNTRPLVIYGTSGIGKSAIMAKAILQAKQQQKDKKVVFRFVGATADAGSTTEVLVGIFDDLGIDIRNEAGKKSSEIKQTNNNSETFQDFSYRVRGEIMNLKDQVVIFIDAVDQLTQEDQFLWFPKNLPKNIKLIVSALEDTKYEDTRHFRILAKDTQNLLKIPVFELPEQLLTTLLTEEGRTVQYHQNEIFLKKYESIKSPLYIHIVAQEMKHWKSFDEKMTLADTQKGAVEEFIKNLTAIYHHNEMFVQKVFGYITASGDGLSEDEIVDLLTIDTYFVKEMAPERYHKNETGEFPLVIWARLYTQLKPFLGIKKEQGKDLLYFFHREFKSIIADYAYQKQEHEAIIATIQKLIIKRQNDSFTSNRWGKLYAIIVVRYAFEYEDENKKNEYVRFVANALSNYDWIRDFCQLLNNIGGGYNDYNQTKEAFGYVSSSKIITEILYQKDSDRWAGDLVKTLNNEALLLTSVGKISEAITLQEMSVKTIAPLYHDNPDRWAEEYIVSIDNLAGSWITTRKTSEEAIKLQEESLKITETLYKENPDRWAGFYVTSLINLAVSSKDTGEIFEAIALEEKSMKIMESLYLENPNRWVEKYIVNRMNLANSLIETGKTTEAIELEKKTVEIIIPLHQEVPDRWVGYFTTTLNNLALSWKSVGEMSKAITFLEMSVEIITPPYEIDPDRWAKDYITSLSNLAASLNDAGEKSKAIEIGKKALKIIRVLYEKNPEFWAEHYVKGLHNLSIPLKDTGRMPQAIELRERALEITEPLYQGNPDCWAEEHATVLKGLATLYVITGKISQALPLQEKAVYITELLYWNNPNRWSKDYKIILKNLVILYLINGKIFRVIALTKKFLAMPLIKLNKKF